MPDRRLHASLLGFYSKAQWVRAVDTPASHTGKKRVRETLNFVGTCELSQYSGRASLSWGEHFLPAHLLQRSLNLTS